MKRRIAKKQHRAEVLARREALGEPVPCPPRRTGVLLVPDGYVGPVLITTPSNRQKVRYVDEHGRVWRDDQGLRGNGHSIRFHAVFCRVEPCTVTPTPVEDLPAQPGAPGGRVAQDALLAGGLRRVQVVTGRQYGRTAALRNLIDQTTGVNP